MKTILMVGLLVMLLGGCVSATPPQAFLRLDREGVACLIGRNGVCQPITVDESASDMAFEIRTETRGGPLLLWVIGDRESCEKYRTESARLDVLHPSEPCTGPIHFRRQQ